MDKIDLDIIETLKKDARTSFRKIARKLKVSPDTIINRYKTLQQNGVIQGSTVIIDPKKIGYECMAIFMIDTEPKNTLQILKKLIKMRSIIIVTRAIGDHDLMAIGVARDFKYLNDLILKIANIPTVTDVEASLWVGQLELCPEYFII